MILLSCKHLHVVSLWIKFVFNQMADGQDSLLFKTMFLLKIGHFQNLKRVGKDFIFVVSSRYTQHLPDIQTGSGSQH